VLAAQSADTMTHPQHRYKGIFVELCNLTFQLCWDNSIKLLFGFPNQNSLPGFVNKLGWTVTEQLQCFTIPTGSFAWHRIANKLPFLQNALLNYQRSVLKKHINPQSQIANSVVTDGFAGIIHNEDYLCYKTYTQSFIIRLGNSTLWIKTGRELLIGDMITQPEDFGDVMQQLITLARKLGISTIQFHASPGTTINKLFTERFTASPSFPVIFKSFEEGLLIEQIKFTAADIDTF